jgi:hypothetical protein
MIIVEQVTCANAKVRGQRVGPGKFLRGEIHLGVGDAATTMGAPQKKRTTSWRKSPPMRWPPLLTGRTFFYA